MIELKYDTDGMLCITECPFGVKSGNSRYTLRIASSGCTRCKHYISKDVDIRTVVCGYSDQYNRNNANS